jgi:hypothetical protein
MENEKLHKEIFYNQLAAMQADEELRQEPKKKIKGYNLIKKNIIN